MKGNNYETSSIKIIVLDCIIRYFIDIDARRRRSIGICHDVGGGLVMILAISIMLVVLWTATIVWYVKAPRLWHPRYVCNICNNDTSNWNAGICYKCGNSNSLKSKARRIKTIKLSGIVYEYKE